MKIVAAIIVQANANVVSAPNGSIDVYGLVESDVAFISACNTVDNRIALTANIDKELAIQHTGWTDNGNVMTKTYKLDELTNEGVIDNQLVMSATIDLAHEDKLFFHDGEYNLSFKCYYPLDNQVIQAGTTVSSFGVRPGNTHDVRATGSLGYHFSMEHPARRIGERVSFAIIPANPGVIYSRVSECSVSNGVDTYPIFGGDDLGPFCADEFVQFRADEGYGGQETQRFSYSAFRWSDSSESIDDQFIHCTVEFKPRPFVELDIHSCDGKFSTTSTTTSTTSTTPTTTRTTTTTTTTSTTTTTTTTTTACKTKKCKRDKRRAERKAKKEQQAKKKKQKKLNKQLISSLTDDLNKIKQQLWPDLANSRR